MPIKISKNYNCYTNQAYSNNNKFSPSNMIDLNKNDNMTKFNSYGKVQSEKKYYSNLKKSFENNTLTENKTHKRNNMYILLINFVI